LRAKIGKKSDRLPEEIEAEQGIKKNNLPPEEAERIRAAVVNAKSLEEIEMLNQMLATGKIPDKDWNNPNKKDADTPITDTPMEEDG
jgi:hypothetical protein